MIELPPEFEADIQGQNLNLFPVVLVGSIPISTKNVTLSSTHYKPLLLSIPSIKESMDFESRKYRISNVTLKISNYEYEGERFSDYVGNLINTSVTISWISQSESTFEVYSGFVRRYSHDDKTASLSIEDSSQRDLHKDVPVARLGDDDTVLDKYKLKPIPMVYGEVDYSPCVFTKLEDSDYYGIVVKKVLVDSNETVTPKAENLITLGGNAITEYPIYVFEEGYFSLQKYTDLEEDSEHQNYEFSNNVIEFLNTGADIARGVLSSFQIVEILKITAERHDGTEENWDAVGYFTVKYYDDDAPAETGGVEGWDGIAGTEPDWSKIIDGNPYTYVQFYGENKPVYNNVWDQNVDLPSSWCSIKFELKLNQSFDESISYLIFKADNDNVDWLFTYGSETWKTEHISSLDNYSDSVDTYTPDDITAQIMVLHNTKNTEPSDSINYYFSIPHPVGSDHADHNPPGIILSYETNVKLREFHVVQNVKVDKLFNRSFFANVNGRTDTYYESIET